MRIQLYDTTLENKLFAMIETEGDDWQTYWKLKRQEYKKALRHSIVYVAFIDNELCGYIRCRNDDGFGIYIYDLLVAKSYRGKNIGRCLINKVCDDFPDTEIYVMSDVDEYYLKQGHEKAGSIFICQKHQ